MLANSVVMAAGGLVGLLLLIIGILLGIRIGRRGLDLARVSEQDREEILRLIQELGAWTSEYSGSVSDYQNQLGELTQAVQQGKSPSESRVLVLLKQIMDSNGELQTRLDAAEKQLEKQTQQIQDYLTEARTDGLTGLANRRALDQKIDELFAAYRKGGRSFVLVLIDIDHFKSINDTYGHQTGDMILQALARTLSTQLEGAMIVARYGGEEFAVLLEGPLRVAASKMNEVRKFVADQRHDISSGQLDISISIGLSEPRQDVVVGPIVRRADECLYSAKNMGRNRVYYDEGRGPTLVGAPEVARD